MKTPTTLPQAFVLFGLLAGLGFVACDGSPQLDDGSSSGGSGASGGSDAVGGADLGSGGKLNVGSGSGSDGGSGNLGGADACADSTAQAELIPANLLFVVDKSGSMNCNAPPLDTECTEPKKVDAQEPSKWEITQAALTGPNGALQTLAGQKGVSAGLIAFPLDDHCEVPAGGSVTVPIAALEAPQLAAITSGLSLSADGQTPLAGAAIRGLEALRLGIHDGSLAGDNYMVVMTDGAETCQEDALDDLLDYVEQARKYYGIRTYAIGAPGSEGSRELLSRLAILGGTRRSDDCLKSPSAAAESCHIDLTESDDFETELGEEFHGITAATAQSCEYDVPKDALIDRNKVNVELTPSSGEKEVVVQDAPEDGAAQCEGADGWQYTSDGDQIVLCGGVCERVLSDPGAQVRVVFGCEETVVK